MTRALVIGANGQLGSDLMSEAQASGELEAKGWTREELDVTQLDSIGARLGGVEFDVLINCSSFHKTDEVERQGTLAATVNAHAVKEMAEVCRLRSARFVHISTDYVFDGDKGRPYTEADCPSPLNVYGATKYLGERLARKACRDTYVIRVASLFGVAGARGKGGNFVETMLRLAGERGELRVVDDITMSPTATSDVANAIWSLLANDAQPGVYHVVNQGAATWYEFASAIVEQAGLDVPVHAVGSDAFPAQAVRPAYSVLDTGKLAGIGVEMPPWQTALGRYLRTKGHVAV